MGRLRLTIVLLLLLPLAAVGQNKKSEPLFNQAVEKSIVGQYEEAIALLHKALKVDPTYAEAYLLLGNQHIPAKLVIAEHALFQ